MMGPRQEAQAALFYEFSLDDHVPQEHLLRSIDRFVDLTSVRTHLADFYSHTGRPSIDPELLIRMLLIGYCFGIRSERRLCEEVHLNLAYRWFCRLDLTDRIPDHSSFSKNRHGRFRESDLLRHVFETTVARCMEEGLVGGQGFAVDASLISADVQKQNSSNPEDWAAREVDPADAPRAVREYLDTLPGCPPYVAARVALLSFGAHAMPVDDRLLTLLTKAGVFEQGTTPAEAEGWLTRQVKAGDSEEAYLALQEWADGQRVTIGATGAKKAPVKKAPAKKTTTKKAPAKKTTAKKAPAKKTTKKKTTKKKTTKKTTKKKTASKKRVAKKK